MKILIIVTMTNNFGKKGMYNSQEIGLARGLSELGHTVRIVKCVVDENEVGTDIITPTATIDYRKCNYFGSNGFFHLDWIKNDTDADAVIQFADLQLSVPVIYRWCKKNGIAYIPYVGITYSQSHNPMIKALMEFLFRMNLNIYRRTGCLAKNPIVYKELCAKGINRVSIAPVCLDVDQLKKDYLSVSREELRAKWGLGPEKVILFIGRFEKDKRPLELIDIFSQLEDKAAKLIMVGSGELYKTAESFAKEKGLTERIRFINRIANADIWEIYRIADVLVNLNYSEIWGMVLLEAMYYRLGIVAQSAPGPNMIVLNGYSGYIVSSDAEWLTVLQNNPVVSQELIENAFARVVNEFAWKNSAQKFLKFMLKI